MSNEYVKEVIVASEESITEKQVIRWNTTIKLKNVEKLSINSPFVFYRFN